MKKISVLAVAMLAGLALTSCQSVRGFTSMANIDSPLSGIVNSREYPLPAEQMSYAPNDPQYIRYVNTFTGTDTHVFKTGDRSFVMRGTPPLQGVIDPWYSWNDMSEIHSKPVAFNDCGKCNLAMGAEAEIMTRNLKGHTVSLEICYYHSKKDKQPQCFKGDTLPLQADVKEWKKLSVTVPFEQFRTIAYKQARLRLTVDDGTDRTRHERIGKAGFEGVLWADNFRFLLAEQNGTDKYNVKLSGALWPDDYSGWDTGWGKARESLQPVKP